MGENRKQASRGSATAAIILMTVVLLGLYMAGYYQLVTPTYIAVIGETKPREGPLAGYRWGGVAAEVGFGPAHWLDRRLRPDKWKP